MRNNMASSANIGRNGVSLSPIRTDTCIEDPLIGTYNAEVPLKICCGYRPPTKITACCVILSRIHYAVTATVRYGLYSKQVKVCHFNPNLNWTMDTAIIGLVFWPASKSRRHK